MSDTSRSDVSDVLISGATQIDRDLESDWFYFKRLTDPHSADLDLKRLTMPPDAN